MPKVFNVTANCKPDKHYMVKLDSRLAAIKKMVDDGAYFTINRARQYGKTTTLRALGQYLQKDYYVVSLDFQTFGTDEFKDENIFARSFAEAFLWELKQRNVLGFMDFVNAIDYLSNYIDSVSENFRLRQLFRKLSQLLVSADKSIVLLIDEVDSASNNQVFLDFLAQLRAYYINRDVQPTFQSVILAGVYDVKNLKRKIRPDEMHKINSPWNIAADFKVDMSFAAEEIAEMLREYEADHHTGMDIGMISQLLYDYTYGYPFLVSRLCKLMDEEIGGKEAWTKNGFQEAVKLILSEKNTLFESLIGKMTDYPEMREMIGTLLFNGKAIAYNPDNSQIDLAVMFGFIKNKNGIAMIANRIFETRLYNWFLSTAEMRNQDIYTASVRDKNQFVIDGYLNMRLILEKFVLHFHELYGDKNEAFIEEEGRKYFLLYLRPIINGVGNYYIEAQTRDMRRTDVIVDYQGEQYIVEMKIWHGEEYNSRGEEQLIGYLEDYHISKGYMLSFNFNKKKEIGVREHIIGDKVLIEAIV